MVEAAGIEPPQSNTISDTLSEQNANKTLTAQEVEAALLDAFQTDPA